MKCLCETELDTHYIIIGHQCKPEYKEILAKYIYEEQKCYLASLCSIVGYLYSGGMLELRNCICRKIRGCRTKQLVQGSFSMQKNICQTSKESGNWCKILVCQHLINYKKIVAKIRADINLNFR